MNIIETNILKIGNCRRNYFWLFITICFFVPSFFFIPSGKTTTDLKKTTFAKLKKIRIEKKQEVINHFDNIRKLAFAIQTDRKMLNFFLEIKKDRYQTNENLEYKLDEYAIINYGDFYDILFVDTSGLIFHSLRKESDFRTNIFKGCLAKTGPAAGAGIKQIFRKSFLEYEFYDPSGEPAAFFAIPLSKSNRQLGWFILQCTINRVNTILTDLRNLGKTGEVYLVNENKLMLSDSRFMEDSTILKLKVDTEAVKNAIQNSSGESIIDDYRGVRVFSSFEKFDLFGTNWIIIAEIDENEVITNHYKKNKKYFNSEIIGYLARRPLKEKHFQSKILKAKRIDINEFAKAKHEELIQTFGVATCTAVAITFKGQFCYLSHISPTDKIYNHDRFTDIFFQTRKTDFLGELIQRVKYFDIYPHELKELNFIIIAPHNNSFPRTVDKIINNGMELSNIKYMYNPYARCANVTTDISQNSVSVKWISKQSVILQYSSEIEDLSTILKKIINYDG